MKKEQWKIYLVESRVVQIMIIKPKEIKLEQPKEDHKLKIHLAQDQVVTVKMKEWN